MRRDQGSDETTLYSLRDHLLIERSLGTPNPDPGHQPGQHSESPRPAHPYNLPPIHHLTALSSQRLPYPAPPASYVDTRFHFSTTHTSQDEARSKVPSPSDDKEDSESMIDPVTGKKLDKSLSTTKRAQQNRAAQRAFRARKESHIKTLEDRLKSLEAVQSSYKQLTTENFDLRAYISLLQARLVEATGSCPPPPPAMNPTTAIDVRMCSEAGPRSESAGPHVVHEESEDARWRASTSADAGSSTPALEPMTSAARTAETLSPGRYPYHVCHTPVQQHDSRLVEPESRMHVDKEAADEVRYAPKRGNNNTVGYNGAQ